MGLNLHFSVFLYPHPLGEVLWERAVPRFPALCALLCYQKGFRGTEQPKLTPLRGTGGRQAVPATPELALMVLMVMARLPQQPLPGFLVLIFFHQRHLAGRGGVV